jgi:hypothetical protein
MKPRRPYHLHCDFCIRPVEDAELLFRSGVGGLPPAICSDCVDLFADITKLNRADPQAAAQAVATVNGAEVA